VKLLLDENLSHLLIASLLDLYPGSVHVRSVGLSRAADESVWEFAGANGFTIVTKDGDFSNRAFLLGPPPKVVWIQLGNCSSADIALF
jgi:predicted nuclease of predicted toxin-antitoxin system